MRLNALIDSIYPILCYRCNEVQQGQNSEYLCEDCRLALKRVGEDGENFCATCSEPYEGVFSEDPICPNCSELHYSFDFARSALKNSDEARGIIHHFKYKKQRHLTNVLAQMCANAIARDERLSQLVQEDPQNTIIMPVPLHWRRQLVRGFNQAELISAKLAEQLNIRHLKLLKRIRYTSTQTKLVRHERLRNLKNAFSVSPKALERHDFKRVIIVDDVFTTGSTSEACAAVIKKECAKVENIVVVTVLRG